MRNIFALIGLIMAGVIYFTYTQPAYSEAKLLKEDIAQYNLALDKATELKKLKEALLSRYNTFPPEAKDRLHKLLPDHVDNVRLILDIDSLASKFNMAIQNVTIESASDESEAGASASAAGGASAISSITAGKQKYDSLTLKFSTHASYATFVSFLEALQSSLRIVDVVSLSLAPDSGASQERLYRIDITIRTYWLK